MPAIGIKAVFSIRRDLYALTVCDGGDATEANAATDNVHASGQQGTFTLPPRTGTTKIYIMGRRSQQGVANPSANKPHFKTGILQRANNANGRVRWDRTAQRSALIRIVQI